MSVNSTGDQNRSAGRDFNENHVQIDSFDGRHTINIAIPSEEADRRPLVKAQRKELNSLVASVAECSNKEAFAIWHKVHAEIGVSSIDDMTVSQYQAAISYLQAMLDRCREQDASRALVSLLLRNSQNGETRQKLIRYCNIQFGTGRLNDLTRPQLQMALSWLDERQPFEQKKPSSNSDKKLDFFQLFKCYTKEFIGVFVIGLIIGVVIF
ncbi:hypothetical protein [Pluralibacter gergoviae]|uniref:hypothetical protein n=1 Tax=Pluralibacter gergoviae TaxID=61647 RepID=UPI0006AC2B91|nr:hypothetical protein [Pluralibacter gergoviae]KOQ95155.1 membrane protein [Pluralibacter gergoviae]